MKKTGELTAINQTEKDTGGLNLEAEVIEQLNTLEMTNGLEDSSLSDFLNENPEIIVSELNKILHWVSVAENWFVALTPIMAKDGNILVRISIAPPKNKKLVIYEDNLDNSKQIIMEDKIEI